MKGRGVFVLVLAGCGLMSLMMSTTTEAAPSSAGSSEYAVNNQRDFRSRRGFKNLEMATARGFGKRAPSSSVTSIIHSQEEQQQPSEDDDHLMENLVSEAETFPVEWLVQYFQKKPAVMRYFVERLLDHNGDGQVTSSEMISSLQD